MALFDRIKWSIMGLILGSFLFVSCGDDDDDDDEMDIPKVTRSIVGTWEAYPLDEREIPGWISGCREVYTFNEDNTFTARSNEEDLTGVYNFAETVAEGTRHLLVFTFETDTTQPDCAGSNMSQDGQTFTVYIEFSSDTEGIWYVSPSAYDFPWHFVKMT